MATNGVVQEEENIGNTKEIFSELSQALEHLRAEEFTWDEDINFLQGFIRDPNLQALLSVNDGVANSQGFDQPVGPSCEVTQELSDLVGPKEKKSSEEAELMELMRKPFVKELLSVHDTVRARTYETPIPAFDPNFHPSTHYSRHRKGGETRTVGLHKSANESLGITLRLMGEKLVIARIMHGGLIHRQGLLKVGDVVKEVNGEVVSSMQPVELQAMLRDSSGSLVIKVEPCHQEAAGLTEVYLRAHFDFNPRQDRLIPSQDAGLSFRRGDILMVLNQEDSFWWQAVHYGDRTVAGLIPSQTLEERRRAYNHLDNRTLVSCLGKRKSKHKVMYSSLHSGLFEGYDMVLYEPVMQVKDFHYRTLILIGAPNIGRRSLKTRLLSEYSTRFGEVRAHTSRRPKSDEDQYSFHFVTEAHMKEEIHNHKFIEFGKHQNHYYGIKVESVLDVINAGKMCILDVHPQALKLLRTRQFCPLVVFVKAESADGVRRLHQTARVDNPSGQSTLSEDDYERCAEESAKIEKLYGHYFDATIINENIDIAYEELMATIRVFSTGKHWVPANWVM